MALEELEITKDNLSKNIFLSILANVSEQYNILLKKETVTIDEITKILSQIMEAYSFFNTIQQSELTQELSDARIQLNQIATTFQNLEQFKGEKGDTGNDGADGTPFTFDMFTPEQLELLRGIQGERGEKGLDGTMTFEDLTPEQIALLKGEKGDNGIDGTPFTYDMFTPEQLALLKGAKGDKGESGTTDYNSLLNKPKTHKLYSSIVAGASSVSSVRNSINITISNPSNKVFIAHSDLLRCSVGVAQLGIFIGGTSYEEQLCYLQANGNAWCGQTGTLSVSNLPIGSYIIEHRFILNNSSVGSADGPAYLTLIVEE